jgi:hypothetical protein
LPFVRCIAHRKSGGLRHPFPAPLRASELITGEAAQEFIFFSAAEVGWWSVPQQSPQLAATNVSCAPQADRRSARLASTGSPYRASEGLAVARSAQRDTHPEWIILRSLQRNAMNGSPAPISPRKLAMSSWVYPYWVCRFVPTTYPDGPGTRRTSVF